MMDAFNNPAFLAGLQVAQGMNPADAIIQGQKAAALQQEQARAQQVREAMANLDFNDPQAIQQVMRFDPALGVQLLEAATKRQQQARLPELMQSVDVNDPTGSLQQLIAGGMPLDEAEKIIGVAQKQAQQESLNKQRQMGYDLLESDFMTAPQQTTEEMSDIEMKAQNAERKATAFSLQGNEAMADFYQRQADRLYQKNEQQRKLEMPLPPAGMRYNDKNELEFIPGSKQEKEEQLRIKGEERGKKLLNQGLKKVQESFDVMENDWFDSATGMGSQTWAEWKSSSDAAKLRSAVKTIQANLSIDSLIEAKKQGATFGALTDRELELLGAMVADLDPSLGEETLIKNLNDVKAFLQSSGASLPQGEGESQIRFLGFE